jgi:hypothetical protein
MRLKRSLALVLALGVLTPAAYADDLRDRVEQLERELKELKEELRRRDAVPPPPPPAAPVAPVAPQAEVKPPAEETARAEKKPIQRQILDRVKLGAYGSVRYEASSLEDQHSTFTFRRFVLTADANIAPRLHAMMELEFERFRQLELEKTAAPAEGGLTVEQTVEGTNESEISFEQGWLQYDIEDWLNMRAGAVLVPLGRFNLHHDDNLWDLPRRSLVDRGVPVLPVAAAWDELGVGFLGNIPAGRQQQLDYQLYVLQGAALSPEFEQIAKTRTPDRTESAIEVKFAPATGTFGSDVKNGKAVAGRLAWSPRLGHELGGSGYFGQYTPDFLGSENLWSLAFDGKSLLGPLELEGEYVYTRFDGTNSVARQLARTALDQETNGADPTLETTVEFELANLARTKQGYWIDLRHRFWPAVLNKTFLGSRFDNPQLVAVLRGEQVWLNDLVEEVAFTGGTLTAFDTDDRSLSRITAGLAYRPVPQVVFQLAYEFTQTNDGKSLAGVTNFLPAQEDEDHVNAVLLGAAFGF